MNSGIHKRLNPTPEVDMDIIIIEPANDKLRTWLEMDKILIHDCKQI